MSVIKRGRHEMALPPEFRKVKEPTEQLKDSRIWGVVLIQERVTSLERFESYNITRARVVTNTTSFHPKSVIGSSLTHEEATAIVQMYNSGVQHGTD